MRATTTATTTMPATTITTTTTAVTLPSWVLEEKEAARIAHRRRLLQQRADRIHNHPRATSIAVDVEGLSQQVEERSRKQEQEKRQEREFMRLAATQDRVALLVQHQQVKAEESRRKDLLKYWKEEQRPERRREADLNSHEHITSALYELTFEGEDLGQSERVKAQQEQVNAWLQQQKQEQEHRAQQEREAERRHQLECAAAEERARQLAEAQEECRRAEQLALCQYNLALSREREALERDEKHANLQAEQQEVRNAVLGAFLTEHPAASHSSLGPHRVITHRWKGMTEEQRRHILEVRAQQVEEKKRREEEERHKEVEWQDLAGRADRVGLLSAHNEHLNAKRCEEELVQTNSQLAKEQQENKRTSAKLASADPPTQDFYGKFGIYPR